MENLILGKPKEKCLGELIGPQNGEFMELLVNPLVKTMGQQEEVLTLESLFVEYLEANHQGKWSMSGYNSKVQDLCQVQAVIQLAL